MTPQAALAMGWGAADARNEPLGAGHINETWRVEAGQLGVAVLQRLNSRVFVDPMRVMDNVARVCAHMQQRAPGLIPELIPTSEGAPAWQDASGGVWRLWRYVEDSRSLERTDDADLCASAGAAFGRFQHILADLPGPPLHPAIAGFHELDACLLRLEKAVQRVGSHAYTAALNTAGVDAAFISRRRSLAGRFPPGSDLIHGDCKLTNVLLSTTGSEVRALVDLDTVMRGHWAWDLGDLGRSVLMGGEDPATKARCLAAAGAGFARTSGREVSGPLLIDAASYMAFMLAVRFLTDHLNGDRYFRVSRRGENLERAGVQMRLLVDIASAEFVGSLESALESCARGEQF